MISPEDIIAKGYCRGERDADLNTDVRDDLPNVLELQGKRNENSQMMEGYGDKRGLLLP